MIRACKESDRATIVTLVNEAAQEEKDRLLGAYWTIPARQRDTSVVLVHGK